MDRNPYLPPEHRERQRAKAIDDLGGVDSPEYQRHWLGKWPDLDNSLRVFRYFPDLNGYTGDPPKCNAYGIGLDPGGTLDAEAAVVVGHGNGVFQAGVWKPDGLAWIVDEDETDKGEGGSWDDSAVRLGPLISRWEPTDAFYDYGSARKDGMKLILDADKRISFKAVPAKDVEQEVKRVNAMFASRKLWVRRGSKLETVLKVCMWDPRARAKGKSVMAKGKLKQNLADALRAALWAVETFAVETFAVEPDAHTARQLRIRQEISEAMAAADKTDYASLVGADSPGVDW
jgi:hypothetical protein